MIDSLNTMKVVASRVGLSAHVIRVWERRYGAIHPERTDTNRRTYSEEQVERLQLLKSVTDAGRRIGLVAQLSTEDLRQLDKSIKSQQPAPFSLQSSGEMIEKALRAIEKLDSLHLESAIDTAFQRLGLQGALRQVLAPLLELIGDRWRDGSLTAAHEHFASAIVRERLTTKARSYSGQSNGPTLVVATPSGQLHELGALLIAASAGNLGWRVIYLGASLPAADIASAATRSGARAVALSIVYPSDDADLNSEIRSLRHSLPADIAIIAGGRAKSSYDSSLNAIRAITSEDLSDLGNILDSLRTHALQQ